AILVECGHAAGRTKNTYLDNTLLLVSHRLNRQKIHLEKEADPDLPFLKGDPDKIGQVFLNLVINAVEAMPEGGTLNICTRNTGQHILVEIADTGQGISQEMKEKIFLPFVTTKKGGLGLGLPIVRRIVEEHKGEISVDGQEGHGTTFRVWFPLERGI
ncbi:hypothetical protein HKBW3S25_01902, partial [Candidatus Hakubella thermalkaliphila]